MAGKTRTALVTGSAGFIGYHVAARLLADGFNVVGFDGMTDYYDVTLKQRRHQMLSQSPNFTPVEGLLETDGLVMHLMEQHKPDIVVHLAAQAGVRWSIENPRAYVDANLIGAFNVLEAVRAHPCDHLLMASTSSIYGANTEMPYQETHKVDTQMSFYAATKKANEAMAHSYSHLYDMPVTMFRFFTVYGPWGRPDMALFKFTKAILEGSPIDVYNHGDMSRDFTYIDDLVEGIRLLIDTPPQRPEGKVEDGDSLSPVAAWRAVNIGNGEPVQLMAFIEAIEAATGREAKKNFMDMQPGDVPATWAAADLLKGLTGYEPSTDVRTGVARFVKWYRDYYQV
ncbi:NAD-dependent epimerase/dehydratase family protein [Litoreibacter arenae]|uniref:UDP-glucuronate 5'-epimerase n=1 Tax=Litoreibacter arenae DSM 19593 TaxID=1123360 RepID=S9RUU6_9RHOB|nr:NAD-dependent epimerase/dehydratase family protein [Litoreibacter arenae]EPX77714.1 UDP-glucuronate 5'-epimerase [Litoreibacter arenae DSM 19593]